MEPDTKPNFTPRAQQALKFSKDLARSSSGGVVSAEHLVVSLFSQSGGILHEVVSALDFNSKKLKQILLENLNKREDPAGAPCVFSEDVENIIRLAQDSSIQFDHNYIGVEHLFLGVVVLRGALPPEGHPRALRTRTRYWAGAPGCSGLFRCQGAHLTRLHVLHLLFLFTK